MPARPNLLKLNKLQLKTLVILQEIARQPLMAETDAATGEVLITMLPEPHGNHFHVGRRIVMSRDASGLTNPAVWTALERKGLVRRTPHGHTVTREGLDYDVGPARDEILLGSDH